MDRDVRRQTAALVEAGISLASDLDLDSLLQRIADLSREVIGARYGAVGVLGTDGMLLRFVYSGIDEETAQRIGPLPEGRGLLGVLIKEGKPLRLIEMSEHHDSYGFPPNHPPMHSFLGVPIVVRGRVFGRLYLTEKEDVEGFTKDDERIALTLAAQAGVAIENARLYDAITERSMELAQSQQAVAVLEERERISKELHDGVIQSIYSVGLSLQGTASLLERDPNLARSRIDSVIAELDTVVRDVRSYIFELQPKLVEGRELSVAVRELARDLEVNTLAHVVVDVSERADSHISERQKAHVIQIIREILSNIARHAEASEVTIRSWADNGHFRFEVEDDGKGFDLDKVTRGHGLRNMDERARNLGGEISVTRREPRGTVHSLRLPLATGQREEGNR